MGASLTTDPVPYQAWEGALQPPASVALLTASLTPACFYSHMTISHQILQDFLKEALHTSLFLL